ncbi:MAG TPA: hypothetical protein VNE21_02895 [Mycobacteriales bacterium]|nr:hypothetical protein [Mycobacteriales bacterium]
MTNENEPPQREVVQARRATRRSTQATPTAGDLYARDEYGRSLLRALTRAQLANTLAVLGPTSVLLAAYPLLATLVPRLATARLGSVPLALVVLGGGIYPPLVALGLWYVRRAERVERRFADLLERR